MATATSALWPTYLDLAKSLDPSGAIAATIKVLSQQNEILDDAPAVEGNKPDGHIHTLDSSLPTITARMYNQGVAPTKGSKTQVTDVCTMLEAYAECDKALAQLSGNVPAFRVSQESGFLSAMQRELARQLFYGAPTTAPGETVGIATRYADVRAANAATEGDNGVFNANGSTASKQTSIYMVCWGPQTAFLIYPKGSQAGVEREDLGQVTIHDAVGYNFEGYRTHYAWKVGLAIADTRAVIRIANIDVASMLTMGDSDAVAPDLIKLMDRALDQIPADVTTQPVFYMGRKTRSMLRRQMNVTPNAAFRAEDIVGVNGINRRGGLTFHGIPCRICEQIVNTEEVIAAT